MAIKWSSYSGGLRVGVEVTFSPASPDSDDREVDATAEFYVDGRNTDPPWNDLQKLVVRRYAPPSNGKPWTFSYRYTGNTPQHVATLKFKRSIAFNSRMGVTFWMRVDDAARKAQPVFETTVRAPFIPRADPDPPMMREAEEVRFEGGAAPDVSVLLRWRVDQHRSNNPDTYEESQLQIQEADRPWSDGAFTTNVKQQFSGPVGTMEYRARVTHARRYKVRARMRNVVGWGAWSNVIEFAAPTVTPRAPVVSAVPDVSTIAATASVSSDGGEEVTGFEWLVAAGTARPADDDAVFTEEPECTFTGLYRDTAHTVWCRAVNSLGAGVWGSVQTSTLPTVPSGPRGLTARDVGDGLVDLSWREPADDGGDPVTGFVVEWSEDPQFGAVDGTETVGVVGGLTVTVEPNTRLFFRVAAVNVHGQGRWGPAASNVPAVPIRFWDGTAWLSRQFFVAGVDGLNLPRGLYVWDGSMWVEAND